MFIFIVIFMFVYFCLVPVYFLFYLAFFIIIIVIISIFRNFLTFCIKCSACAGVISCLAHFKLYVSFSKFRIVSRFNLYATACIKSTKLVNEFTTEDDRSTIETCLALNLKCP